MGWVFALHGVVTNEFEAELVTAREQFDRECQGCF